MVYVQGERAPEFIHNTFSSAENEAKRLAKLTEKKTYVLAAVRSYELSIFKTEDLISSINDENNDLLPF